MDVTSKGVNIQWLTDCLCGNNNMMFVTFDDIFEMGPAWGGVNLKVLIMYLQF